MRKFLISTLCAMVVATAPAFAGADHRLEESGKVLQEIIAFKQQEVAARKAAQPRFELNDLPAVRDFAAAISRDRTSDGRQSPAAQRPVRLIAVTDR